MPYDPRTETGIPTEPVGSLPRSARLQAAYADYDAGTITKAQLEALQDDAVRDSISRLEATGSPIVSDGEQRWSSFATYPIADTLAGTGLAPNLAGGGQYFAIFADGHHRQLPRLTGGPFRYQTYAADTLAKSIRFATKPMKQAVIAPSMLALLYPLNEQLPDYGRAQFEEDLLNETEKDIRQAFAAGAARVSLDFTEGRLATRADPRNPWTGAGMLPHFIELNNRVLDRFTAEERTRIGVHTCPGGDRDSVHSADVPYSDLLPSIFKMNAGYFLIQMASERDKDPLLKMIGEQSRDDANGVRSEALDCEPHSVGCAEPGIGPPAVVDRARTQGAALPSVTTVPSRPIWRSSELPVSTQLRSSSSGDSDTLPGERKRAADPRPSLRPGVPGKPANTRRMLLVRL
jgi:methionine synthase II (cobalamin-independent)